MKKEFAIILKGVTKEYSIHHPKPTLSDRFVNRGKKISFKALDNLDLVINKGDKVGIIGSNGSGKTTLLKIMSGIAKPTKGEVLTNGRTVSLIDISAGFHPDLNGRENILINGLLVGMLKREIDSKIDEIIEFADIGDFIDMPMYTYSDGMQLRLGFSIAVHSDADILILDEGFGVGDGDFRRKVQNKIEKLFEKEKTLIVVSHWLKYIEERCEKVVYLDQGKLKGIGKTEEMIKLYEKRGVDK